MAISKKLRFEVFKRDNFICQYCGKTPPKVTLEIDHINPKSKKGKDEINNLLTACFDCNRGKSNISLKRIPNTLVTNLEVIKEKEFQLKEYNEFLMKIENRLLIEIEEIDDIYNFYFSDWRLSDSFKNVSLKRFLRLLPKQVVVDAMKLACYRKSENSAIRYFCGICWNKIRGN